MKSTIVKRSVVIGGHKTSVSLEDPFWTDLKTIAQAHQSTLSELLTEIDGMRNQANLSSAIRLFVLNHFRNLSVSDHARHEEKQGVAKALYSAGNGDPTARI